MLTFTSFSILSIYLGHGPNALKLLYQNTWNGGIKRKLYLDDVTIDGC
ncbi:MAG: hypothetical protein ACXV4B_04325 [Halobacteriota archaeon]